MCENCQVANQHFTDGQKDRSRPLHSSTEQGTSPDWGGRTLPPVCRRQQREPGHPAVRRR